MRIINLIPDTSVLFYYVYGSSVQKNKIKAIFNSYGKILINNTIKIEIGRTIFQSYFSLKGLILSKITEMEKGILDHSEFWTGLYGILQKKFSFGPQKYNRVLTILSNIHDYFDLPINKEDLPGLSEELSKKLKIFRIKNALFVIENELAQFYKILLEWDYIKQYDCHQDQWLYRSSNYMEYEFQSDFSCAENKCPNRISILETIYRNNNEFIINIIQKIEEFWINHRGIKRDNKLLETLNNLHIYFSSGLGNLKNGRTKYCWALGDFLISLIVNDESFILTRNVDHFQVLLHFRNLERQLIPFNE